MSIVTTPVKSILFVVMIVAAFSFISSPVRADECGTRDRVAMPSCVQKWTQSNVNGWGSVYSGEAVWYNTCSEAVTLKFDKPAQADARHTIQPSSWVKEKDFQTLKVSCCPKYGRCSF